MTKNYSCAVTSVGTGESQRFLFQIRSGRAFSVISVDAVANARRLVEASGFGVQRRGRAPF